MKSDKPRTRSTILKKALTALSIVLFLALWEIAVRLRGIAPIFLPAPSSIAIYLWRMIIDGTMEYNLAVTLLRIFAGFSIAAVTGIGLGLLMGMSPILARVADVWMAALYPLPKIALIPLLLISLGSGEAYRIVISAVTAFFPVVISTYAGIRQVDLGLIKAAKDLGRKAGAGERRIAGALSGWLGSGLQETWDTLDHLAAAGCHSSPIGRMTTSPM